jgi:PAS domain S-box-containing protein
VLVGVVLIAALVAPAVGYFVYLPRAEADARRSALENLGIRVELRVTVIRRWLTGGLADARLVASYPSVHALTQPGQYSGEEHLVGILRSFASIQEYSRVLVSRGGQVLLQTDAAPVTADCVPAVGTGWVRLHRHGDRMFVAFFAPIDAEATAGGTVSDGVVTLEQAADDYLYPLMTREFLRFPSAESFLVAPNRDGTLTYLSPPRSGGHALGPVPTQDGSARLADGPPATPVFDARGREVLAVGRGLTIVPGTVVMKVDADEVLAEPRRTSRATWLAGSALILAAALGVVMLFLWQRRRHAELVAFSQAHLGQVLDHASDPILFLTEEGRIAEANSSAHEFYGYPPGALRGLDGIDDLHVPEDRARGRELFERAIREGEIRFETRHKRTDGTSVPVDVNLARIDLDSHIRAVAVVRDMTEHAAARSRAEQTNRMLRVRARVIEQLSAEGSASELLDAACRTLAADARLPLAWVAFSEPNGSVRVAARAGSAANYLDRVALGWGPDAAGSGPVGRAIRDGRLQVARYGDEGFEPWPEIARTFGLAAVAASPIRRSGQLIGAIVLGSGEQADLSGDMTSLVETIAGDLGLALSAIDAREARRTQSAALQESETRLRAIFEQSPIGIAIGTLTGQIERINPALEQILGYSEPEMRHMTFRDVTPESDLAREEPLFEALAAGQRESYSLEKRFFRKDHRVVWGELTVSIVRLGNEPLFVLAAVRDVTDRRALQEQLLHSQKLEGIGRLAGGVAHDFNNLLTAILGYAEVLASEIPGDHPGQMFLSEIQKAGSRAAALTSQLLAFARRQIVQPRTLDLGDVVSDARPLLERLVGDDVALTVATQTPLWKVEADANQLQQILVNMVVNARDAMPSGGTIRIDMANEPAPADAAPVALAPRDFVRLSVTDTGVGMPPEVMAHIFEPFFTTKEQGKGTGLGLATCHGIVVQSGGEIRVRSDVGHGTTFDVRLPRASERPRVETPAAPEAPARGRGEVVLLAEDEGAVRAFAARCLTSRGYEVLEASTGAAALEMARTHQDRIRLLLTDVVMPGMGGRELAERFRVLCPAPVLYMSGHPEGGRVRGDAEEHIEYLAKPFTADQLVRRVRDLLDGRTA